MKKVSNTKPVRIDPLFEIDLRKVAAVRVSNNLAKPLAREISTREMTMLLRRTQGYQMSLQELMSKAKRENCK